MLQGASWSSSSKSRWDPHATGSFLELLIQKQVGSTCYRGLLGAPHPKAGGIHMLQGASWSSSSKSRWDPHATGGFLELLIQKQVGSTCYRGLLGAPHPRDHQLPRMKRNPQAVMVFEKFLSDLQTTTN